MCLSQGCLSCGELQPQPLLPLGFICRVYYSSDIDYQLVRPTICRWQRIVAVKRCTCVAVVSSAKATKRPSRSLMACPACNLNPPCETIHIGTIS